MQRSEDSLAESALSFYPVGPTDRTRAIRLVPTDISYRIISQTHLVYILRQDPLLISSVGLGRLMNELQGFSCLCASLHSPGTGLNHYARSVPGFSRSELKFLCLGSGHFTGCTISPAPQNILKYIINTRNSSRKAVSSAWSHQTNNVYAVTMHTHEHAVGQHPGLKGIRPPLSVAHEIIPQSKHL